MSRHAGRVYLATEGVMLRDCCSTLFWLLVVLVVVAVTHWLGCR